jgi:hypothetical protein
MKIEKIGEYFSEVETTNVGKALTIVILGSMCGLPNTSQIHQWASSRRARSSFCRSISGETPYLVIIGCFAF